MAPRVVGSIFCPKMSQNVPNITNIQYISISQAAPCARRQLYSLPLSRQPQLQNRQVGNLQNDMRERLKERKLQKLKKVASHNLKTARLEIFKRQRAGAGWHFDHNLLQFSAAGLYSSRFETIWCALKIFCKHFSLSGRGGGLLPCPTANQQEDLNSGSPMLGWKILSGNTRIYK